MAVPPADPWLPAGPAKPRGDLLGLLAVILSLPFCCQPLGLVLSIVSLREARKQNQRPTMAYISFGILALDVVADAVYFHFYWS